MFSVGIPPYVTVADGSLNEPSDSFRCVVRRDEARREAYEQAFDHLQGAKAEANEDVVPFARR